MCLYSGRGRGQVEVRVLRDLFAVDKHVDCFILSLLM